MTASQRRRGATSMFYYLKDGDPEIDGMMQSVCETGGGGKQLTDFSIGLSSYPETAKRAEESVATAKRQPKNARKRKTKKLVYSVQYNRFRGIFERAPGSVAVAWNGLTGTRRAFMAAARDAGCATLYLERAPLPGRVTVDPAGINQLSSVPRDPDFFRTWAAEDQGRTGPGWRALKEKLQARAPKRSDVSQGAAAEDLGAQPFVFCPLQVPDDTQIRQFGGWVGTIERFVDILCAAAAHLPDGWHLRFKEHPSSKIALGDILAAGQERLPGRIVVDNSTDTFQQVADSRTVITLNSSVGLQAFYYDRPVIVLGEAYFRQPGLVTPIDTEEQLAQCFADIETVSYDAPLRDAFMNYLDQVYYPTVESGPDGKPIVQPELVLQKIADARSVGTIAQ